MKLLFTAVAVMFGLSAFAAAPAPTMPAVAGSYVCSIPFAPHSKPEITITEQDGQLFFDDYFAGFLTQIGNQGLPCQNMTSQAKTNLGTDTMKDTCTAKAVGRTLTYAQNSPKKTYLASILVTKTGATKISLAFQDFPVDQNGNTMQMPKFTWACVAK